MPFAPCIVRLFREPQCLPCGPVGLNRQLEATVCFGSRRRPVDLRQRVETLGIDTWGYLDHGREPLGADALRNFCAAVHSLASFGLGITACRYDQGSVAD